jgi:hypothetical protein
MRRALAFVSFIALSACSSSSSNGTPPGTDAGMTDTFTHDIVFTMETTVPASTEMHQCKYVQMPAGADSNIYRFAHEYTTGSHHFLLYLTDLMSIPSDMTGTYDCTTGAEPILSHSTGIIYGGQVPQGEWSFPSGVAATVKAGQVLVMNTHYLNTAGSALDATVKVGLDTIPAADVMQQGGFFIFYDPFIDLPAHAMGSSGIRCSIPADVTVVNAFSHYHFRGTDMKVFNDLAGQARATTPFYTTTNWEHPQNFSGPSTWKQGDTIRFQCDYDNTSATEIFQGPNAQTSEMCVLAGLYYPRQVSNGFENCAQESVSGFGTQACLATAQCVQACNEPPPMQTATGANVGPCWQHCVAAACDGAVDTMLPLFGCAGSQCATECQSGASACISCASTKCSTELTACSAQACQ